MTTPEQEIRDLIEKYYDAFNKVFEGKPEPEMEFWSSDPDVVLMTAGGDRVIGREAVNQMFSEISKSSLTGTMSARDISVKLLGDVAVTTCIEHGDFHGGGERAVGDHRATHIFRREDGEWRLILRHADADPDLAALVNRVQAA